MCVVHVRILNHASYVFWEILLNKKQIFILATKLNLVDTLTNVKLIIKLIIHIYL